MKRMNTYFLWPLLALTSCQQISVLSSDENEGVAPVVSISADIAKITTRVVASGEQSAFTNSDKIGLFMGDNLSSWTYNGSSWASDNPVYWRNVSSKVKFEAFYPYASTDSREAVPVPSLTLQTGKLDDLSTLDFLVASAEVSYSENNGLVSFTEDNSFKHALSFIKLTLSASYDLNDAQLNTVSFSSKDFASQLTYSFDDGAFSPVNDEEVEEKVQTLTFSSNTSIGSDDLTLYFLLNPVSDSLTLTLDYTKNEKTYQASTTLLSESMEQGHQYATKITVNNSTITLGSLTISSWETETLPDQTINSNEVNTGK